MAASVAGLDNAGKTTLVHRLKTGDVETFAPTQRALEQDFVFGGLTLRMWDVGGHQSVRCCPPMAVSPRPLSPQLFAVADPRRGRRQVRRLWPKFLGRTDAILFLVDAADPARLAEAREELHGLLAHAPAARVPVAVLGNKSDVPGSLADAALREALGLDRLPAAGGAPVALFVGSVLQASGYPAAFAWLGQQL